jgi:multisubunit Na+/H+ antiporter MnhC subunit
MHADIISGIAVTSIVVGLAGQAVLLWIAWRGLSWTPAADIATIRSGIAVPKALA